MKAIEFKFEMSGKGIVNYDSKDQKWTLRKLYNENNLNDNNKFAKKVFYEKGYKIKISSDCLRHNIYAEESPVVSSYPMYAPVVLANYIGSINGLTRGYMFASVNNETIKRKSCLTITDAIQTNDAVSYMETYSKSGERNDTSLFNRENIGEITYSGEGYIDFRALQFVSFDDLFDRLAVSKVLADGLYESVLERNFGKGCYKRGYFAQKSLIMTEKVAEDGVLLSDGLVKQLTKDILRRVKDLRINLANGYAKVDKVMVKIDGEWVDLDSMGDFTVDCDYVECDKTDVLKSVGDIKAATEVKKAKK